MEKDEKTKKQPNIFQLLWFVYKRYYKDTKFAWQIWTFFFFEVLDNAYPLLFSYMLAKVIDRSMSLISTNGSFEQMMPTIVIFGIMTIVWIGVNSFYQ